MMMSATLPVLMVFSVLVPVKMWFSPTAPLEVDIRAEGAGVSLVLTDFTGKPFDPAANAPIDKLSGRVDLRSIFPQLNNAGTYILYAYPAGQSSGEFLGTPIVISVRQDNRRGAVPTPMVVKMEPLRYAVIETEQGPIKTIFYYDVAPNTTSSFLTLAEQGFFDGLGFHRVVRDFVIQGGDPRGDGTGGPGYQIDAEFNDRPHEAGVLSMARSGDPNEQTGAMPRSEFANSAGSQFFICLNYANTKALDKKYTAFGRVVEGMDAVQKIGQTPVGAADRPITPQIIKSVRVVPVTAKDNPYAAK